MPSPLGTPKANSGQAAVTWLSTRVGIGFNSAPIRARIAFWQREWGTGHHKTNDRDTPTIEATRPKSAVAVYPVGGTSRHHLRAPGDRLWSLATT